MKDEGKSGVNLLGTNNNKLFIDSIVLLSYTSEVLRRVKKRMEENPECAEDMYHVDLALQKISTQLGKLHSGYIEALRDALGNNINH